MVPDPRASGGVPSQDPAAAAAGDAARAFMARAAARASLGGGGGNLNFSGKRVSVEPITALLKNGSGIE